MRLILLVLIIIGAVWGYRYISRHQEVIDEVVQTTNEGYDAAISAGLKAVAKATPLYYFDNRSYGESATKNICFDDTSNNSLGSIIADIEKYTKAVTCTVDPDFPSRSFTITAPSRAHAGEYLCADQSGFVGLVPDITKDGTFRLGIKCR